MPHTVPAVKSPVPLLMLPAVAFTTDQTGTITTTLPFASLPTAVKVCVPPGERLLGFGLTVIDATGPTATFTVAKPETPALVACTVLRYGPDTVPAVKSPVPLLMLPAVAFTTDQVGVNWTMLPTASLPTAMNCCVLVAASVTGVGVTTIVAKTPALTVIDAFPEMLPTEATTGGANAPGVAPAVKIPVEAMVPPPAATVQVGDTGTTRPSAS